jgi:UDP-N-acetylmuramoyl-tripeptide--D-alanyl-D-alanine ligase
MPNSVTWRVADLVEATRGTLVAGPVEKAFSGVSIDSRTIRKEEVFVAIKGMRYDGHAFIPELMRSGIQGVIVDQPIPDRHQLVEWAQAGGCCIMVTDTTRALGDLAAFHRRRLGVPVAAITGSNGKTTTKEMTAAVLAMERSTLSTRGNLNNEIGLPLTLLRLDRSHEAAVVELGMNHPGEIDRLGEIARPEVGVITNIGPAHLEGLRDTDRVMAAKAELLGHIQAGGAVVLNAGGAYGQRLAELSRARAAGLRILWFGLSEGAEVRADSARQQGLQTEFELVLPDGRIPVCLAAPGRHMLDNALAAAAAAHLMGSSKESIKAGLERFRPVGGRMAHTLTERGVHIIDDSYNANPGSMKAAIEVLVSMKGESRAILVAGDMLELGAAAPGLHYETGQAAAAAGVDRVYVSGDFASDFAGGAKAGGLDAACVLEGSEAEILEALSADAAPGDWVLVKGSRGTGMERIVQHLTSGGRTGTREGSF